MKLAFPFLALAAILLCRQTSAATFNIANGDIAAFRSTISSANTNGQANTINLASEGMYLFTVGDGNHDALTWINSSGGHLLTINGNGATLQRSTAGGTPVFRIFEISTDTTISDLTIANGEYSAGGGIRNITGNLTVVRCTFLNNLSSQDSGDTGAEPGGCGGAIHNATGNLTVQQCLFQGNIAEYNAFSGFGGGAIISGRSNNSVRGTLTVSDSTFENNIAKGILANNGVAARSDGGAIANEGNASITRCTFTDNSANRDGGALSTAAGQMVVSACLFAGNHVQRPSGSVSLSSVGGAVACSSGQTTLTNCTFYDNETRDTSSKGGAIYNRSPQLTITSCTFKDNNADGFGASCIFNESPSASSPAATVILGNTILSGPSSHSNLSNEGSNASITSQGYNLSTDNVGNFLTGPGDQINTPANLENAPKDNGGPTQTIAPLANSPAIDKGKSFGLTQDQRGFARPIDLGAYPNASGGDASDIGAFELVDTAQAGPNYVVNTNTDHNDGICGVFDCSLRDAIVAANAAPSAPTITFAANVTGTITLSQPLSYLVINRGMTISGPGARVLAISGGAAIRVLAVNGGPTVISGLTIRDGLVAPSASFTALGGGLLNSANLTVNDCAFLSNLVLGGDNTATGGIGAAAQGGAIHNAFGALTLNRCTFSGNGLGGGNGGPNSGSSNFGGAGGSASGGAIFNAASSSLTLNNCTFYNNIASAGAGGANPTGHGGNGGIAKGAAVFNAANMIMTACTVRGNNGNGGAGGQGSSAGNNGTAGTGAGGVTGNAGASSSLQNCLIAENTGNGGTDANGTFSSSGYNLIRIGDFGSGFTGPGDQVGTTATPLNAMLGPLQNNGGPTDTIAPLTGSPAIDRGKSFGLTSDQRGFARPYDNPAITNANGGDGSDIGAYELIGLLIVNTLQDHDDGLCSAVDCTLREAINSANANPGNDVITFLPGLSGTIQLSGALPILSTSLSITGPGKDVITVRRNTGGDYRIFTISDGTAQGPQVSISGLTITNGLAGGQGASDSGGGILNDHSTLSLNACAITDNASAQYGFGGGLFNQEGNTFVDNCTFANNTADTGGGVANYYVDGSNFFGHLTIRTSTLSGNHAESDGGGAANYGQQYGAELRLTNSTVSGNTADRGGGVYNVALSGATVNAYIYDCTFSGNAAPTGGGLYNQRDQLYAATPQVFLQNDIFKTGASGVNIVNSQGTITSNGYNLSNDTGGGFLTGAGDQINTNPSLGPLQNNGGQTFTHALLPGSPAIDKGTSNGLTTDQRGVGYLRTINDPAIPNATGGDGTDVGAFEFGARINAGSRKTHGSTDLHDLDLPVIGPMGIECRRNTGADTTGPNAGRDHEVVITFPSAVTVGGVSVTSNVIADTPTATLSVSSNIVTIDLHSIPNARRLTINLTSVSDGTNTNNVSVPMGVLLGDTTGNGSVNSSDIGQTKGASGQTTTAGNFRTDVTTNGSINSSDIGLVKSNSGTALPP